MVSTMVSKWFRISSIHSTSQPSQENDVETNVASFSGNVLGCKLFGFFERETQGTLSVLGSDHFERKS